MDMFQPVLSLTNPSHETHNEMPPARVPRVAARLIEYAPGSHVALPPHTSLELIEHPAIVAVPGTAYYGCGMLSWQGRYIPVIDLAALLRAYQERFDIGQPRYALIVAYQRASGAPIEYGALALAQLPQIVEIGDDAWCDLPTDSDIWPHLSLSCVQHEHHAVPILDTAKLFMAYHG